MHQNIQQSDINVFMLLLDIVISQNNLFAIKKDVSC